MKKIISLLVFILLCFTACRTIQYVPIHDGVQIEYRDTTITKDSIVYIPKETIKEVVPMLDTLSMESSMAKATAWLDTTTTTLKGKLENKKGIEYKYVYKDKIVYKDSISVKEVPVPVEVTKEVKVHPWYERLLWIFSFIGLGFIIYYIYKIWKGVKPI